jgi:transposase
MKQIQKHLIKTSHKHFKEIDELCFKSKNLYNSGVYLCRQALFNRQKRPSYCELNQQLKSEECYKALPAKVAQQILMLVDRCFKSFEEAHGDWVKRPDKYLGEPKYPKYKHKERGRYPVIYTEQAISKSKFIKGIIQPSKTDIQIPTSLTKIQQVRFVPYGSIYKVEVVYNSDPEFCLMQNDRVAGIDLGLNNLATVVFNVFKPIIICGKAVKSANAQYNKRKAKLQSLLPENRKTSKKIEALTLKRNSKIDYYLHTSSRAIINYCLKFKITHLIVGKNKNWKQNINIGKRNNQFFTCLPHAKLIE